jgi:hypothetical protein
VNLALSTLFRGFTTFAEIPQATKFAHRPSLLRAIVQNEHSDLKLVRPMWSASCFTFCPARRFDAK